MHEVVRYIVALVAPVTTGALGRGGVSTSSFASTDAGKLSQSRNWKADGPQLPQLHIAQCNNSPEINSRMVQGVPAICPDPPLACFLPIPSRGSSTH